ncbi:MAG: hypothetical protein Q9178_004816 [Gyalolechia marmorata]
MPDPFALLPLPLPIFILNDLEDLVSLHSILLASPSAYRIFNEHYIEIIESILPNFVPQIQRFFRIIVSIRSQPLHTRARCSSIEAFNIFRSTTLIDKSAGTHPLSKSTTTLNAARSLTKTAAKLQGLSNAFFVTHLARVNSFKPRGARNKDPLVSFKGQWTPLPSKLFIPYEIIPCGKPSWIEEQRVLRALFRVVVWLDLQIILAPVESESKGVEEKGIDDVWGILRKQDPNDMWSTAQTAIVSPEQSHEMHCVVGFLKEVWAKSSSSAETIDDNRLPRLQSLPNVKADCYTTPALFPRCEETARMWQQWTTDLDCEGPGSKMFRRQKAYQRVEMLIGAYDREHSLGACDFKFLAPLGIPIWDREKLVRLGLDNIDDLPKEVMRKYLLANLRGPPRRGLTEGPSRFELLVRWRSLFIGRTTM